MKYVRVDGDVAYVQLTKGFEAIIDSEDVERVSGHSWHVVPNVMGGQYARSSSAGYMHRFIMNAPKGVQVDHEKHNTLDNRKQHLRIVTNQQNCENRGGAYSSSKTGIRGVTTHKCKPSGLMYAANVQVRGKHLAKYFPHTPEGLEAATVAVQEMRRELMPHSTT